MPLESDGGTSYASHDLASAIAYTSGFSFAATVLHFGNASRETFYIGEIQASDTPLFWLESESHGGSATYRYWIGAGFDGGDSDWIALTQPIASVNTATGYVLNICATFDPSTDTLVAYANGVKCTPSQQLTGTGNFLDDVTRVNMLADESDTNVPPAVLQRFAFWDKILDENTQSALSELTCLSPLMIQDGLKIYIPYFARYVIGGTFTQEIVNWIAPTETITKTGAGLDTGESIAMIQGSGMLIPALAASTEPDPIGSTGFIPPQIGLQSGAKY